MEASRRRELELEDSLQVFAVGSWINPSRQDSHLLASVPVQVLQFTAQSWQGAAELPGGLNFLASQAIQLAGAAAESLKFASLQEVHLSAPVPEQDLQLASQSWQVWAELPSRLNFPSSHGTQLDGATPRSLKFFLHVTQLFADSFNLQL